MHPTVQFIRHWGLGEGAGLGRGDWTGNMTIIYNNNIYDELFQQQCLIVTWVFEHILPIFVSEELRFQ